ncbi:MAG TPA: MFS transporter [Streptosporangiaceae bacterium]|nr:MFS transporter [Streptosporangiaceae bacterium]
MKSRSTTTYDGYTQGSVGQHGQVRRATLAAASLGFSVIQLDVFVVNVGIKAIGTELGGGTSALQWVMSAYPLLLAAFILTAGALADRFGARRMYCTGFVVFVAASLACGLAPTMGVLIAARAVQGVGAAVLGACSLALLNHTFHDPAERTRAVGLWAAGASVALALGPVLGGLLIAGFGWRSIFFINLPIGALGYWLTRTYAQETPPSDRRLDLTGLVAGVAALGGLAFALIQGGAKGFVSLPVVTALAIAAMAAAIFFRTEATEREPMLPLTLFQRWGFTGPAVLGLLVNVTFYGLVFVFSLLLQKEDGFSPLATGLAFLPLAGSVFAANLGSGRLSTLIGSRSVILIGLAAMFVGCLSLLWAGVGTPFGELVVPQMTLAAGIGLLVPAMTSSLMGSVDRSHSGVAAGTLNTMRQTGSVLGVAVFGSLVSARFTSGLHVALVMSMVLIAASAAVMAGPDGAGALPKLRSAFGRWSRSGRSEP